MRFLARKDPRQPQWTPSLREYTGSPRDGGKVNPDAVHIAHLHAADEQYASEKWENAWKRTIGSRKPDGSFEVAEQQWELAFSKWKVAALIEQKHKVRATTTYIHSAAAPQLIIIIVLIFLTLTHSVLPGLVFLGATTCRVQIAELARQERVQGSP